LSPYIYMIAFNINPATKDKFDYTCHRCSDGITKMQTDKIIRHMVRMPASLQTLNVASANVYNNCNPAFAPNWNQHSDRNIAHIQRVIVPSHGNSTKQTLTRARPGACSAGGAGVDVKHGSYDRYLARLKGKSCNPVKVSTDVQMLSSSVDFEVNDFCWALRDSMQGPFYKAVIMQVITPNSHYRIQFLVNGVVDGINYTKNKSDLLLYTCAC